jgi:hypothetical protein
MTRMRISLPYLAMEARPTSCGATVQSRLSANASSATITAGIVHVFAMGTPFSGGVRVKSRRVRALHSKSSLAMLMMEIDNPMEAAARQMTASRKLIVFVRKMVVRVA